MASETTRTAVKCICGRTHRNGGVWVTSTGIEHGCRYAADMQAEAQRHSPEAIKAIAAEHRARAEHRFACAHRADGTVSEVGLSLAREDYAKAYEVEN